MPEGTAGELLEKAGRMYRELSKETGAFFDFMLRYGLFDLETKPGKQQAGTAPCWKTRRRRLSFPILTERDRT